MCLFNMQLKQSKRDFWKHFWLIVIINTPSPPLRGGIEKEHVFQLEKYKKEMFLPKGKD